jgi:cytochrome c biogenesis protein CcmG, thiol:disulfide interchange protein DsbE
MKSWTKLAVLVVAAVLVAQLLVRSHHRPAPDGDRAAPALALPDLGGRTVDLAGLRGKVVAVNFWATWCGPCRMELPDLAQVWRAQQGHCFELLGIAEESGREDVADAAQKIPYPVLLDHDAGALDAWGVQSYPTTYLVDAEGRIRSVFRGALDKDELTAAIGPLLPASCPRT